MPGGGGMGFPVTERGGPPGGGGIGRPVAPLGACAGAEGGGVGAAGALVAGGADPDGGAAGAEAAGAEAAGAGAAGAEAAGAEAAGAEAAGAEAAGAEAAGAEAAGAEAAGAEAAGAEAAGAEAAGAAAAGAVLAGAAGTAGAGEGGGELVGGEGLTVLAAGGRIGEGALGCSDAGRLVINLAEERLGGIGAGALWVVSLPVLSPAEVLPSPSPTGGLVVSIVAEAVSNLAAAFLVDVTFLSEGAGSSGWTGRRSPSRSALRRARSAWASSMDDE